MVTNLLMLLRSLRSAGFLGGKRKFSAKSCWFNFPMFKSNPSVNQFYLRVLLVFAGSRLGKLEAALRKWSSSEKLLKKHLDVPAQLFYECSSW